MGVVEVAVVGLIGFVGLLVLVSILLMDRVLALEKRAGSLGVEQQRHCRMLETQGERIRRMGLMQVVAEHPAPSLDPVAAQCGPACRTEMAPWPPGMEKVPWCATHRRWWAPEGPG